MSHVPAGSMEAGSAAAAAEAKKVQKYSDIINGVDFTPVAIETSGVWGENAMELFKELGWTTDRGSHTRKAVDGVPATAHLSRSSTRQRILCPADITSRTV